MKNKTNFFIIYREVTIGPTALLALMTSRHTNLGGMSGPHLAILLCFLAGIVEFIMALLRLGALVDLISLPVTIGFTSATALIIGASQLKVNYLLIKNTKFWMSFAINVIFVGTFGIDRSTK